MCIDSGRKHKTQDIFIDGIKIEYAAKEKYLGHFRD